MKGEWINGIILQEAQEIHLNSIENENKNEELGVIYDIKNMTENSYQTIQKNIKNSIGIFCDIQREKWHNDSRIFYINSHFDTLDTLTPKKITEKILFCNIDFLLIDVKTLGNSCEEVKTLLKNIQNKSWKTFKNKL